MEKLTNCFKTQIYMHNYSNIYIYCKKLTGALKIWLIIKMIRIIFTDLRFQVDSVYNKYQKTFSEVKVTTIMTSHIKC